MLLWFVWVRLDLCVNTLAPPLLSALPWEPAIFCECPIAYSALVFPEISDFLRTDTVYITWSHMFILTSINACIWVASLFLHFKCLWTIVTISMCAKADPKESSSCPYIQYMYGIATAVHSVGPVSWGGCYCHYLLPLLIFIYMFCFCNALWIVDFIMVFLWWSDLSRAGWRDQDRRTRTRQTYSRVSDQEGTSMW